MERNTATETEHKTKVLFVDDDALIRDLYQDVLEGAGFAFATATNGREALQRAQHEAPDIILLDLMMPGGNGVEVLRSIKRHDAVKDVPVILFTNYSQEPEYLKDPNKIGAAAVLKKSDVAPQEVVDTIHDILSKA